MKESVMETVTTVQENAADILASAKDLNDEKTAAQDACRMEHAISEESFRKLMQALEHPQETP